MDGGQQTDAPFIPGLELSRRFYAEVVRPILAADFPALDHAAALLGPGSEVLGYDTTTSTDHDWGPRLLLFVGEHGRAACTMALDEALDRRLPDTFLGYPTRFTVTSEGHRSVARHRVTVESPAAYFAAQLSGDPRDASRPTDWLTVTEQVLLQLTAGAVFHDGPGELTALRASIAYYPRDIWLYRLAMQWQRVAQRMAFIGRSGDVGDALGSTLLAASTARDLMRICFLLERRYAPYEKWFGTAFARLACAPTFGPLLGAALAAPDWRTREAQLSAAYAAVLALHNTLGITPPIATTVARYFDRPYLVPDAEAVVAALLAAIDDPAVRALPPCGAADQLADSTDFLTRGDLRGVLRPLYG